MAKGIYKGLTRKFSATEEMARSSNAKRVLEEPLIAESFDTLELEYFNAWKASSPDDKDARERLWMAAMIIGKVRSNLQSIINSGKIAQAEVDKISATPDAISH